MKGNDTITTARKKHLLESLTPAFGARRVGIFHEASSGDSGIDLTNLNMPSTYTNKGYANPSDQNIALLRLSYFKSNVKIISSARGTLLLSEYDIASNTQINFDGFTASSSEVFEIWYEPSVIGGATVVDARPLVKSYLLPEGDSDVTVEPFEINANPLEQIGKVMVFRGPTMNLQFRNSGNATASVSADGNYEEVKGTGGLTNIIRFNVPAAVGGENVVVVSIGALTERPSQSLISYMENMNGDLDKVRDTVAALSGQPKSNFNGQPQSVDLASFGERFNAILNTEITIPIFEEWQSFTPTWTASISSPTLGNGSLTGRYLRRGSLATVEIFMLGGTTTAPGVGSHYFNLPSILSIDSSSPISTLVINRAVGVLTETGLQAYELAICGTSNSLLLRFFNVATGYYQDWFSTSPFNFTNTDEARIHCNIPIQSWSQNETKTLREMAGL